MKSERGALDNVKTRSLRWMPFGALILAAAVAAGFAAKGKAKLLPFVIRATASQLSPQGMGLANDSFVGYFNTGTRQLELHGGVNPIGTLIDAGT
jgi:hypothetical protein